MLDQVPVESRSARKALSPVVLAVPSPRMRAADLAAAGGDTAVARSPGSGRPPSDDLLEPSSADPRGER